MAYLYRHLTKNKNIEEIFYIGIGSDSDGKYKRAFDLKMRSKFWHNMYNKYDYQVEIILDGLTWEQACFKEKEFINLYGRRDLGLGTLVNLTNGGDGSNGLKWTAESKNKISILRKGKPGKPHTEEFKNKMREIQTGRKASEESKRKNSEAQIGRKTTEETKKKMSESRKGQKRSIETKKKMSESMKISNAKSKKVVQISTGIVFNSIKQASEELNIPNHNLKKYFSCKNTKIKYPDLIIIDDKNNN